MSSRNLRVGIRRTLTSAQTRQPLAPSLPGLLDDLADAVALLGTPEALPTLLAVAARLDPALLGASTLADQVLVGQVRVVVIDLLEAQGMEHDAARAALPQLTG